MNSSCSIFSPYVVESTGRGETRHDLFSRLLQDRIIMLCSPINDVVANLVVAQLLYLDSQGDDDIKIYIMSPGGQITSLFAIYDTMKFVKSEITTVCIGQAASAAAVILSAGTPGKRLILPNARVLIHQPLGGASGQASDIEITAREIIRMKEVLNRILAENTGQSLERIMEDTDRDYIMTAEQAVEYGIVDKIVGVEEVSPEDLEEIE